VTNRPRRREGRSAVRDRAKSPVILPGRRRELNEKGSIRTATTATKKGTTLVAPFVHQTGENETRTETKTTPKRIRNSGHHRSSQNTDSLDELIATSSCPNPNRESEPHSICSSPLSQSRMLLCHELSRGLLTSLARSNSNQPCSPACLLSGRLSKSSFLSRAFAASESPLVPRISAGLQPVVSSPRRGY
jgi:hypothetical protein